MTLDELEQKIIEVKKKGLAKIIELKQIKDIRSVYYKERIQRAEDTISNRFYKNLLYLANRFKSFPSNSNIEEFMGMSFSPFYDNFIKNQAGMLPIKDMILISEYYGVPLNLLIFEDIEIYGEQIWKEYNTIFKQSKY